MLALGYNVSVTSVLLTVALLWLAASVLKLWHLKSSVR